MSRGVPRHEPVRPLWLCRRCGLAWPCGAARLSLLTEYRGDRASLLVYLATLMVEAADQLAVLDGNAPPPDLTGRFLDWARPRKG